MNKRRVGIYSVLIFCALLFLLSHENRAFLKLESIYREHAAIDDMDYHFIAVNFALKNQFPILGFLTDEKEYKLHYHEKLPDGVDSMYLDIFRHAGPVLTFIRPPLYPLMVGTMYKLFGFHLWVLVLFNVFLLSLIGGLMPFIGYRLFGSSGFYIGIGGAVLFYFTREYYPEIMDVEIPTSLLYLLIFFVAMLLEKKRNSIYLVLLGTLIGLELLTKPIIILLPPLYIAYIYFKNGKPSLLHTVKWILPFIVGFSMVVFPWVAYINYQQAVTTDKRVAWAKSVSATMPVIMLNNLDEIEAKPETDLLVTKNLIKSLFLLHITSTGKTIFLTNQFREGTSLLYLNNEYCINSGLGSFGWQWPIMSNSYYNTHHLNSTNIMKVVYFYLENPSFIYRIPWARMVYAFDSYPIIFWLSPALWALSILILWASQIKVQPIRIRLSVLLFLMVAASFFIAFSPDVSAQNPMLVVVILIPLILTGAVFYRKVSGNIFSGMYMVFWLSAFLFILIVYGEHRFTKIIFPLNCLSIAYYSYIITRQTIKNFDTAILAGE